MPPRSFPLRALALALLAPAVAVGQAGRGADDASLWSLGARAVGVVTHASPAFDGRDDTEARITQPALFAGARTRGGRFAIVAVASLEGLTLRDGETSPGIWGEGFADRRHPHTYLHELVAAATVPAGRVGTISLAAGKGFVPFGTDDPMVRPFVTYPANHHLSQILERALVAAAWRAGPLVVEGAVFNGDEPEDPADAPNLGRFGDSWAARLTMLLPADIETQASVAAVASPEWAAGFGPDQRKWSASARHERGTPDRGHYVLVEWARTDERVDGRTTFDFETILAEGAVRRRGAELALRLERTTRPEEERLLDPFRTARPHTDESILGVTRFEIATLAASVSLGDKGGARRVLSHVRPFVEVALARPSAARTPSLFRPERFFGARRLWSFSAGARLSIGSAHRRMGRYGAAVVPAAGHLHPSP